MGEGERKKEFLGRYRLAGQRALRLEEELWFWSQRAAALALPGALPEAPAAAREDPVRTAAGEVELLRRELAESLREEVRLRRGIEEAIQSVRDPRLQELLRYRYIHGWTWERIAEHMDRDMKTVWRWHKKCLDLLALP